MAGLTLTEQNFNKEVMQSDLPVVVDFWAAWCVPCRIVSPVIEQIASEYEGKVKVGKLNVDENPDTASRFGIMSIPTVLVIKKGEVTKTIIGARGKEDYKSAIDEVLGS